jgi:hypothetical protein
LIACRIGQGLLVVKHRAEIAHVEPAFKEVKLNRVSPMASARQTDRFARATFLKVSIVDQRINMQPCTLRSHHRIAFESSRNMMSTGTTAPSSITPTRSCDVCEGEMTFLSYLQPRLDGGAWRVFRCYNCNHVISEKT